MNSLEFSLISASLVAQDYQIFQNEDHTSSKIGSVLKTLKCILKIFGPVYFAIFLQYIMPLISIAFAGHLDTDALAAAGLANSVINVTAIGVGAGLASAFDILAPQALGAKKQFQVGILLQRLLMILLLIFYPIVIALWVNIDGLLKLCHEPLAVAKQTRLYLLIFIPGLFALFLYRSLRSYVQIQGFGKYTTFTCILCVILHILFNYVFIFPLGLGLVGVALATTLSIVGMPVILFLFIYVSKIYVATWNGFTLQSFLEWASFAKLAVLAMVSMLFEVVFNELTVFIMGLKGTKELGAQAVLFQVKFSITLAPLGWGLAMCYVVGEELGRGSPKAALNAIRCSLIVCMMFGSLFCIIVYLCRDLLGHVFTEDVEVQKLISDVAFLVGFTIIAESLHFCIGYGAIAIGKPQISVICVGIGSYLVGLPISVLLTFRAKMGMKGMWVGICVGVFTQAILQAVWIFCFVDFTKASKIAQEKAGVHPSKTVDYGSIGNSVNIAADENGSNNVEYTRTESIYSDSDSVTLINHDLNDNLSLNVEEKVKIMNIIKTEVVKRNEESKLRKQIVKRKCLIFLAAFVILVVGIFIRLFCYDI